MLLVFYKLIVFMLVLMLHEKYRKGVMVMLILLFRIILVIRTTHLSEHLQTKGVQITEDALYINFNFLLGINK